MRRYRIFQRGSIRSRVFLRRSTENAETSSPFTVSPLAGHILITIFTDIRVSYILVERSAEITVVEWDMIPLCDESSRFLQAARRIPARSAVAPRLCVYYAPSMLPLLASASPFFEVSRETTVMQIEGLRCEELFK